MDVDVVVDDVEVSSGDASLNICFGCGWMWMMLWTMLLKMEEKEKDGGSEGL